MLRLTRKLGDKIFIGENITVTVKDFDCHYADVCIEYEGFKRVVLRVDEPDNYSISEAIEIRFFEVKKGRAVIGINAPKDVAISRDDMKSAPPL